VDLSRREGESVLDAHRQTALRDLHGGVRSAALDGKRPTAITLSSTRPSVTPVWSSVVAWMGGMFWSASSSDHEKAVAVGDPQTKINSLLPWNFLLSS